MFPFSFISYCCCLILFSYVSLYTHRPSMPCILPARNAIIHIELWTNERTKNIMNSTRCHRRMDLVNAQNIHISIKNKNIVVWQVSLLQARFQPYLFQYLKHCYCNILIYLQFAYYNFCLIPFGRYWMQCAVIIFNKWQKNLSHFNENQNVRHLQFDIWFLSKHLIESVCFIYSFIMPKYLPRNTLELS